MSGTTSGTTSVATPVATPVVATPVVATPVVATPVVARNLGKSYGTAWALRGVDLVVESGEAIAVFGANGAGKSTLLRLLATITPPSFGTLQIYGRDAVRHRESARRMIGVLGHQSYLYSDLTAAENLALYARLYNVEDAHGQVWEALSEVGLEGAGDRRVRELSRGMQQRLALARATLHRPPLLLLDEPDGGLDPDGLDRLQRLLARRLEGGQSVVMATHRLEVGLALCQKAVILSRGKAVRIAPSQAHSLGQWRSMCRGVSAGTEVPAGMDAAPDAAPDAALEARNP